MSDRLGFVVQRRIIFIQVFAKVLLLIIHFMVVVNVRPKFYFILVLGFALGPVVDPVLI